MTKEQEYLYLVKMASKHQVLLCATLFSNYKSVRKSAWLRLMGLVETWDIVR